jgi:hypothetical protein
MRVEGGNSKFWVVQFFKKNISFFLVGSFKVLFCVTAYKKGWADKNSVSDPSTWLLAFELLRQTLLGILENASCSNRVYHQIDWI